MNLETTASWDLFWSSWALFRDPLLVAAIAGTVLGYLGVFIVLRRMVFVAAALSQSAGCGVAFAFFAQIHWRVSATVAEPRVWSLLLTLLVAHALRGSFHRLITREGLLAVIYVMGAAGALMLGTRISQEAHDIQSILFGTGVMVSPADLRWVALTGLVIGTWQLWWRRGFLFASFDPQGARVRGLPVAMLDITLLMTVAVFVSVATHALGALPVFALSVAPALAAVVVSNSPLITSVLAATFGMIAAVGGYLWAFWGAFPVGASQTCLAGLTVLAALVWRTGCRWIRQVLRSEQDPALKYSA